MTSNTYSSALRLKYGISDQEYDGMLRIQHNSCAICKKIFGKEYKNQPVVDHCHDSGWVRGLLCQHCNKALGCFEDNVDSMQRAIEYIICNATPTEFNPMNFDRSRKKYSEETRRRMSEAKKGRRVSEETKRKMSLAQTGKKRPTGKPSWNKGLSWSSEMRQKMSEGHKRSYEENPELRQLAKINGTKGAKIRWNL